MHPDRLCDFGLVIEPLPKPRPVVQAPAEPGATLLVFADVLDELRFNAGWRPDRIGGGLIVGRRYSDPAGGPAFCEVEGFLAGTHVADVGEFSRYLRVQWKAATASLRFHFPEAEVLGWYLAVPSEDRAPSLDEVALHETFFTHPWQRGLLVPPRGRPLAVHVVGGTFSTEPVGVVASSTPAPADPPGVH